ncbi:unnamed protein product [Paramecium sonneborni]|uniref:Uncharacterized protein n=1 Tax=Paramecium sonneborni TaxID=65129 RepID=A0A8S1KYM8_9CILI|nr:unnamed protein product [Paramecium sonneborni]
MNNFQLFDNRLILQQQLLLQQMFIYNQMLVQKQYIASNLYSRTKMQQQQFIQKTTDENESSSPSISKLEETFQVKPIPLKSTKKLEKLTQQKKPKRQDDNKVENKEPSQKKKIFLSMLDIKETQYKKFKIIEIDQEKKAIISSQAEQ